MPWFVYIARCNDDSLYTGVTTDVTRRINEHNGVVHNKRSTLGKGAKYTQARRPVTLAYVETCNSRSDACKREAEIKTFPRLKKLALINSGD